MSDLLIKASGLSRDFGGVKAVSDIDLEIRRGEVVGIMGPNGAGKSTLLSLLAGVRRPTGGELVVCGKDMRRASRTDAARLGVGLAHQIPKPFRKLTVRQNIQVAAQVVPRRKRSKIVQEAIEICGMASKADARAGDLGLLDLKRLELARVLALDPEIVLLDEVAAGLTGKDLDELIDLVGTIRDSGRTIVIVEHVQEVLHKLARRVVVLEWGQKLCEGTPEEVSLDPRVIEIYIGQPREKSGAERVKSTNEGQPLLEVSGVCANYGPIRVLSDVSFTLYPGEVLAVLGANGAGKTTLAQTVQGTVAARSGSITLDGHNITSMSPHHRLRSGMALVPEGRRLFGTMSVRENLELGLRTAKDTTPLDKVYDLFPRLVELAGREASTLSGGEQQMVAIGRAMASEPRVIVFDELSLGLAPVIVDRMLAAVEQIASWGTAVILIEQNVHQALELSDRVLLLKRGEVVFSGVPSEFSEEAFQRAYLGVSELSTEVTQPSP